MAPDRTRESIADALGRTPKVSVIAVIEVRFLRGAGITPNDPVREVIALFRDDGTPIVEIDPYMDNRPPSADEETYVP